MREPLRFVLARRSWGRLIEAQTEVHLLFSVLDLLCSERFRGESSSLWSVPTLEGNGPLCRFGIEWHYEAVEELCVLSWWQAAAQQRNRNV